MKVIYTYNPKLKLAMLKLQDLVDWEVFNKIYSQPKKALPMSNLYTIRNQIVRRLKNES